MRTEPGTYALILTLAAKARIVVGRKGKVRLPPGYYVYLGSALGPGGVRARIEHHTRVAQRPHWHIDYLRAAARIERVWYSYGCERREHLWAAVVGRLPGASAPLPGFGASDCGCASHLFHFPACPSRAVFARAAGLAQSAPPPRIGCYILPGG